jgi:hypothetical protein
VCSITKKKKKRHFNCSVVKDQNAACLFVLQNLQKKKSPSKIPNQNQYIREMANSLHALPEKH